MAFFDNEKLIKAWNEHQRLNAEERSPKLFMNEYMQEWTPLPVEAPHQKVVCREKLMVAAHFRNELWSGAGGGFVDANTSAEKSLRSALKDKGCESCIGCRNLDVQRTQVREVSQDLTRLEIAAKCKFNVCAVELSAAAIQGDAVFPSQKKADPDVPLNYDGSW